VRLVQGEWQEEDEGAAAMGGGGGAAARVDEEDAVGRCDVMTIMLDVLPIDLSYDCMISYALQISVGEDCIG